MLVVFLLVKGEFSQWLVFVVTAYLGGDSKDSWETRKLGVLFHFDSYFCQKS